MEEQSKRKRKPPKRYQDMDDENAIPEPERKVARRNSNAMRSRRKSVNDYDEFDLEVAHEVDEDQSVADDDLRSEHSAHRSVTSVGTSQTNKKFKGKAHADGPPSRKKSRKVVVSDSEEEDYMETEMDMVPDDDDDDYLSPEEDKPKPSKGKGKATSNIARGAKRKAKGDPAESSRPALERKTSVDSAPAAKKRARPTLRLEETLVDVVGDDTSILESSTTAEKSSPAMLKHDSPVPALPPKKLKLPTIKKNKLPGSAVGTPTSATSATKTKPPLELSAGSKPGDIRKTQAVGIDLDLSNKSVYQELFKTASDGGAPRTGLNRRTKEEERRKELNKQREDWKASRATEAVHSFNLQAQFDKISQFEEKLRSERSAALYPNFMAAKWREYYEREKRRQKEQEWVEGVYNNGREEGEVK